MGVMVSREGRQAHMFSIALIVVLQILERGKRIEMLNINKGSTYMYRKVLMGVMVSREGRQAHFSFIALILVLQILERGKRKEMLNIDKDSTFMYRKF